MAGSPERTTRPAKTATAPARAGNAAPETAAARRGRNRAAAHAVVGSDASVIDGPLQAIAKAQTAPENRESPRRRKAANDRIGRAKAQRRWEARAAVENGRRRKRSVAGKNTALFGSAAIGIPAPNEGFQNGEAPA
jgi:hypothetical protein